jgi:poly [ADP-ribose] polymerase
MITKDNGLRYAKLIHVSVENGKTGNSNKVYIMEELADGRIRCDYGRVGKEMKIEHKDKSKWNTVYKQKLSKTKGYTDVTELMVEPVISTTGGKTLEISDKEVKQLIDGLMAFANKSIQQNYKVTQEAVSEQQVNAAQDVIDSINKILNIGVQTKEINDLLMKLYTTIPRKMKDVRDHLFEAVTDKHSLTSAKELLQSEQDTLDTMAGQVTLIKQKANLGQAKGDVTILEQMGVSIEVEKDPTQLALINKLLGVNKDLVKRIFRVNNPKTKSIFETQCANAKVKKKRLYFHGSRNENWFNLLQSGLLIRPPGAIHTGSMFGDGLYFADKAQKARGYSSLKGSRWTQGSSNKGYIALFELHLGNQRIIEHHDSSCYSINYKSLQRDGYDSVFAKGGYDLINNEYVLYNGKQCTITHLMEIN